MRSRPCHSQGHPNKVPMASLSRVHRDPSRPPKLRATQTIANAAMGEPRGAVRPNDHPLRRGILAKCDAFDLPGRGIKSAGDAGLLTRIPNLTGDAGSHVVRKI